MQALESTRVADEIIDMFRNYGGSEYAGEKVTQLQHMMQAGAQARAQGFDDDVVLAAFLHDIGHICVSSDSSNQMDGFGTIDHEQVGADFLKSKGFSKRVIRLVESHVEAKRYLTYKDPEYYGRLSEASKATLEYQGGAMLKDEAEAFEQYPLFDLIIKMRLWDEEAKVENSQPGDLLEYHELIRKHLLAQSN